MTRAPNMPARPSDSGPPDPPKFAEPEREHVREAIEWAAKRVLQVGAPEARATDKTGIVALVASCFDNFATDLGDVFSLDEDYLPGDVAALLRTLPVEEWPAPKPRPSPYWDFAQGMARGMAELHKGDKP